MKRASDIRPNFNASDLSLLLHLKAVFVAVYARPDVRIWTDVSLIDVWDPVFFLLDSVQDGHCCFAYVVAEKRVLSFWSGNEFSSLIPHLPPPSPAECSFSMVLGHSADKPAKLHPMPRVLLCALLFDRCLALMNNVCAEESDQVDE